MGIGRKDTQCTQGRQGEYPEIYKNITVTYDYKSIEFSEIIGGGLPQAQEGHGSSQGKREHVILEELQVVPHGRHLQGMLESFFVFNSHQQR